MQKPARREFNGRYGQEVATADRDKEYSMLKVKAIRTLRQTVDRGRFSGKTMLPRYILD